MRKADFNELFRIERSMPIPEPKHKNIDKNFGKTCLHVASGLGMTTPAVYTAWYMPCSFTRRVISRINTGATRFERNFLCTQRKLISTIGRTLQGDVI
jgi:hypothetical protein